MSNVNVTIGGRDYAVACAPGEEDHVGELGHLIDSKLDSIPGAVAQSEARSLLFAALLLADEVHEWRATAPAEAKAKEETHRLDRIAQRLEILASHLEGTATNA